MDESIGKVILNPLKWVEKLVQPHSGYFRTGFIRFGVNRRRFQPLAV